MCQKCYLEQLEAWLNEEELKNGQNKKIILQIKEILDEEFSNRNSCVLCGEGSISICSLCFYSKTEDLLRKNKIAKRSIQHFLTLFNYSFYCTEQDSYERDRQMILLKTFP